MKRIAVGIIVGILWMLIAPFLFTEWEVNALMNVSLPSVFGQMSTDVAGGFYTWLKLGFHGDGSFLGIFTIPGWMFDPYKREVAWMIIMSWLSTAFIIGLIVKERKKSVLAAFAVYVIMFALFLIFMVLSGVDMASVYSGPNLWDSLNSMLTGFLFSMLGAFLGAKAGGGGG